MTGQVFDWLTHFPILSNRYTEWPGFFCSEFGSVLRTQSQCQIVPFFPKGDQKWGTCKLRNGKKKNEKKRKETERKKKRKENMEKSNEKKRKKKKRKKTKTK